jgi:diaminopimelate epimerase
MHGCGNDYLFATEPIEPSEELIRALCDRRRGIGADGLITLRPEAHAVQMRIFNADGSDGGMCGNGARCAARLAIELGWTPGPRVTLNLGARSVLAERLGESDVRLTLPSPTLDLAAIPVDTAKLDTRASGPEHRLLELPAVFVNVGNPHMVSFVDDADAHDLGALGPRVERHPAFPDRINLHLARAAGRTSVLVRTWERGAGMTLACGTGALATVVAGVLTNRLDRAADVHLPGGTLRAEWLESDNSLRLTGPTAAVCEAEWTGDPIPNRC